MTQTEGELVEAVVAARRELITRIQGVLGLFPTSRFLTLIDSHHPIGPYKYRSPALMHYDRDIEMRCPNDIAGYHAVVMLELIERSLNAIGKRGLPAEIVEICLANFSRIVTNIVKGDIEYMRFPNDRFDKDLAAASLRLICAGAKKFHEIYLPIGFAKRHPFAWSRCAIKVGLRGTLYNMHLDSNDPLLMADFNEEGLRRFYRRMAELLKRNSVKGVMGASWYYDPALREISPRLAYQRSLVVENGGISMKLRASKNDVESATRKSETRRRLYEKGEYRPTAYALIWLRDDLLAWAEG